MKRVRKNDLIGLIEDFIDLSNIQLSKNRSDCIQTSINSVYIKVLIFIECQSYSASVCDEICKKIEEATFGNLKLIDKRCTHKDRYDVVCLYITNGYEVED